MTRFALAAGLSLTLATPALACEHPAAAPTDWTALIDRLEQADADPPTSAGEALELAHDLSLMAWDLGLGWSVAMAGDHGQTDALDEARAALDLAFGILGALGSLEDLGGLGGLDGLEAVTAPDEPARKGAKKRRARAGAQGSRGARR